LKETPGSIKLNGTVPSAASSTCCVTVGAHVQHSNWHTDVYMGEALTCALQPLHGAIVGSSVDVENNVTVHYAA
jgi:hypothetical protein